MISKTKLKFIKSLQIKKFRREYREFFVEGAKSVLELLSSDFKVKSLLVTEKFLTTYSFVGQASDYTVDVVKERDLEQIGLFSSNNSALAVAEMKENKPLYPVDNEFVLLLDEVKDPGNLGTIIRIADWYGITKIICSQGTTDFYNPKVISASMGSFTRVNVYYCDLIAYFNQNKSDLPVFAAKLEGVNIHELKSPESGFIIMGNESVGIRPELDKFITKSVHIPRFGQAESLNVAIATAVILDNFKRNG
ncbi:MAG TPA: RNA methyltransferase [Cytophagaceae bacterium]